MKASELIKRAVKWHLWDERETDCTRHKSVYACNAIKSAADVARLGLPRDGAQAVEVLKAEERAIAAIMGALRKSWAKKAAGTTALPTCSAAARERKTCGFTKTQNCSQHAGSSCCRSFNNWNRKATEMLTMQEIFDKVVNHMLTQGKRSAVQRPYLTSQACLYRGPDGLKCAVGCLIPDSEYSTAFDDPDINTGVAQLLAVMPKFGSALREGGVDTDDRRIVSMLASLQNVHDEFKPRDWRQQLESKARIFGLQFNWKD